ncbi:uncharacterized protein PB18E9.04c-like [Mastacembelus armatus]|uniref:uncharacterized protein PB18E9.04c-like n=1 Tax=Mastacembelus armatus TaxID=205130 RepID=UPI000E458367|nr:uncharacterized protein PB18E9.04c-like [Mastacembelus armatus]
MELPLGGPALRHYTQSRPRPHRQKLNYRPSRPQETIIESENEVLELMGRVDEGVEEFFTKRVLPTDTLKKQDEESITVQEVAPATSVPCPPPTKTLRRKLGDFFTLKKRRGLKSETSHEGRPKKASIADLIRPLREVARAEKDKDKDRVKEHDKENEKEKVKEHPCDVTGESAVQETPVSGAPPLRGEAVPPRRALREGKSQSLILLSGSAAGTTNARNNSKKQFEGQHSFEQKLHLMLQRIGVSKPQPGETQNQEGEMKKAESEGTIIDSKPEPPTTFSKPRTMSASSDTRHQIRPSVSAHESAGKPALLPKPVIKPGPLPTTSGRNTPENELAQIQEGETNTPAKLSPAAAPSPPAAPALTATTAPTISNSIPDLVSFTVSLSSTVTPPDSDICTDSVNSTAAASTPTNLIELDSKTPFPEVSVTTSELTTSTFPTTLTNTITPTDTPLTAVSVTSTSSEVITPSLSVTSTTTTTPSITASETVFTPSNESMVSTTSTNLSAFLSVDVGPASGGDAAISITTTTSSPSTSESNMPSGLSTTTNSVTETSDDSTSVTYTSLVITSPPYTLPTDTITVMVSPEAPITTSSTLSSAVFPSTTTTTTANPTSTACMKSDPPTPSPIESSVPSTSSSETTPTHTTSTATSLNRADTTPTSSSAMAAAISSPLTTDSDPCYVNSVSTTPTIPGLHIIDKSSAASQHLTSPPSSNDSPGQDSDLQMCPEEISSVEPIEKGTAEKVVEINQKSKLTETAKKKEAVDGGKKRENENEKPTLVSSEVTKKEMQEESAKPQDMKEGEQCSDEGMIGGQQQEETKSMSEK